MCLKIKKVIFFISIFLFFLTSCKTTESVFVNHKKEIVTTLAPTTSFESNTIDGILVTIADQVILLSDLQQALVIASHGESQLTAEGRLVGGSFTVEQAQQILENLMNQKVLQIKAADLGLEISEEELSQRIQDFLQQQGFHQKDLELQLEKSGKTFTEYRAEFKIELLKQQLIARVISPLVNVTEDEVQRFYLQQKGLTKQVNSVNLRSLVIHVPEKEKTHPLQASVVKILQKKIAAGESFLQLVRKYSMALDVKKTDGLLPPKMLEDLPVQLSSKIVSLQPHQVIGPVVIGHSVFFFEYLGAQFSTDNELGKNYSKWKGKLQDLKFNERLIEYLKAERAQLKTNVRPFVIHH
jgi:parvulin-like peptidyl-prolyl isomerase